MWLRRWHDKCRFLGLLSLYLSCAPLLAQTLSQRAIYERCHAKLVRETPEANDPFIPQILAGTLTGAAACRALAEIPRFGADNRVPAYTTDPWRAEQAKKILSSVSDLHSSWLSIKDYEYGANFCSETVTKAIVDPLQPSYYFTRAFFGSSDISSVLRGTSVPRAIRTVEAPTQSIQHSLINNTNPVIQGYAGARIVTNGALLGVGEEQVNLVTPLLTAVSLATGETVRPTLPNVTTLRSLGGGLLGSPAYLLNNFSDQGDLIFDLSRMPRTWSKWVFKDLLCRDLPVIGPTDGQAFVAAAAPGVLPFRLSASCTQCHASMDQFGGLVRNFRNFRTGATCLLAAGSQFHNAMSVRPVAPTLPLNRVWKAVADANYHKEPSYGRFFYRTYNDVLVNVEVNSLEQLGAQISSLDDYYICAAKRYYQYFTGIDVDLSPMNPTALAGLPPDKRFYRSRVVNLGLQLKANRNPLALVQSIFALPEYSKTDLDLRTKAATP